MTKLNRKAVSEMIGYVLLIAIAIAISLIVYTFVKAYVPVMSEACPDETKIIIENYTCLERYNGGADKVLRLSTRNQGLHTVEGFVAHISNESGKQPVNPINVIDAPKGEQPGVVFYIDDPVRSGLAPGEAKDILLNYTKYGDVRKIEIKPFRMGKNTLVLCEAGVFSQDIEC